MLPSTRLSLTLVALALPSSVSAQTIASRRDTTPYPGVHLVEGRTANPTATFHAALISLCTDYVHVTATRPPTALQRPSAWATATRVQLATNGDFFVSGPRVYGYAIGGGVAWPVRQTGIDPAVSGEWYYRRYGWIGFGPHSVEFSHTEWVKQHAATLGVRDGWMPSTVTTAVPRGLTALVSGFPELITEGHRVTCASPTASTCFPDRTDMRTRNPRTAMGLTRDRRTFILLAIDGRESASIGMYGTEEARLMELLGAWQAFNIDGGGSTSMWLRGRGVINVPSDPAGERAVANHWGIFAGSASGQARTPGSCYVAPVDAGVTDAGARDASLDTGPRDVITDIATDRSLTDVIADRALTDIATDRALTDVASDIAIDRALDDVASDASDAGAMLDASDVDDADERSDTSDEAEDEDASPVEELPEFADAPRAEMPPVDAVEEPGCGCRSAPGAASRGASLSLIAFALVRRRRRRR